MCPLVVRQTTYWVLLVLENIVVQGPARAEALQALWVTFGGQVRMLELELGSGVSMGDVGSIVEVCPVLEELNLRLGMEDLNLCSNSTVDSGGRCNTDLGLYAQHAAARWDLHRCQEVVCQDVDGDHRVC
jgi:hypothetical protein